MHDAPTLPDLDDFIALRRDLHAHPELGFEEHRTAHRVAERLGAMGIEVHTGIAGTGVVGVLRRGDGARRIGLRADMDALPLQERNRFAHASRHDGRMHACGHDGHTTMLLAAASLLARNPALDGSVHFIFQPAEEMGKAGAKRMIDEGLFERFPCEAVFGLHNFPLPAIGGFATNPAALMASSNTWRVTAHGRGGHASAPHLAHDPVAAVLDIGQRLRTLLPTVVDSRERALLAVTQIEGSGAPNIIPDSAWVGGTLRTFSVAATDAVEAALRHLATHVAAAHRCSAEVELRRASPPLVNDAEATRFALGVMREVAGAAAVDDAYPAVLAAEDFAHMLLVRPGCYAFIGNGDGSHRLPGHGDGPCLLHATTFDFNDALIPVGARYFARLAERWLAAAR